LASFPGIDEGQARKIVGLPTVAMSSCGTNHAFSKDELDIFSEYGRNASEYYVIKEQIIEWDTPNEDVFAAHDMMFATVGELLIQMNDYDKNVADMISKGEDSTAIAKATESTIQQVAESIAKLTALEVISQGQITDLGQNIVDQAKAPVAQFEVVYSYKKRPDVPAAKSGSREFCAKLIELNRLYTREDINNITARVKRNVWTYRGGWYTNPDTQVTTPFCRHIWVQQLVIKR
jgi:asparagine synthetase B (glutamine-hydrolysing)